MAASKRAVVNQIQENNAVYVSGLGESVGFIIKNRALEKYEDFKHQPVMISLSMNSILDLSDAFEEGQATLFSQERWHELQARFPEVKQEDTELAQFNYALLAHFTTAVESKDRIGEGAEVSVKLDKISREDNRHKRG